MHLFVHVFCTKWSIWQITYVHTRPYEFLDWWKANVQVATPNSLAPSLFPEKGTEWARNEQAHYHQCEQKRSQSHIMNIYTPAIEVIQCDCGLSPNIVLITRRSTARTDEMQKWSIVYFHGQLRRFNSQQTASPARSSHTIELNASRMKWMNQKNVQRLALIVIHNSFCSSMSNVY